MTAPDLCPLCGADLTGETIPEKNQVFFGGGIRFMRCIAQRERGHEHAFAWRCPDCKGTWPVEGQQP